MSAGLAKGVWLVADDYAQAPAIDAVILELAQAGRLSATSVFSHSPHWPQAAQDLRHLPDLAVGLHFNLTHAWSSTMHSLPRLILAASCNRLPESVLRQAWREQLDRFEEALGRRPDYIDGHQHVHQLQQIRRIMLSEIEARYAQPVPLRSTWPRRWRGLKAAVIAALGSQGIPPGWRMNTDFAGVYGFQGEHYAALMRRWLQDVAPGGMIMCHPGAAVAGDPLQASRPFERAYLASADFVADLEAAGARLLWRQDIGHLGMSERHTSGDDRR